MSPISLLYGFGILIRNFFYRTGLLKSAKFDIPIISVGNLTVGGAGKTPHVEYLISFLKDYLNVGTLSRGYNRKSKGFILVNPNHNAEIAGDEPLQFKQKYPEVTVAVAEIRSLAIPQMIMAKADLQVILLDDAFQHLAVEPGLNILLTEYDRPFTKDFLLPSGRLREWRSAYKRADIIVISKCPPQMEEEDKAAILQEIRPFSHQQLFFSYYAYFPIYNLFDRNQRFSLHKDMDVLLICAIANTEYLLQYLHEEVNTVFMLEYPDHHYFSKGDIGKLGNAFKNMESKTKVILTTEKDATRLALHRKFLAENQLPVFVLPVEVKIHFDQEETFKKSVSDFLLNFKT